MVGDAGQRAIWWIDQDRLAGSHNPTDGELRSLRRKGFSALICLLDLQDEATGYSPERAVAAGYAWYSIPVADFSAPTLDQIRSFLSTVDSELEKAGKVLVHCAAGVGRTGTMAAAYWVAQGFGVDETVRRIRSARPGAIESPSQRACLRDLRAVLAGNR